MLVAVTYVGSVVGEVMARVGSKTSPHVSMVGALRSHDGGGSTGGV